MPIHTGPDVQGAAVVTLRGECDAYDEPALAAFLRERIAKPQPVIVDFSHATFVDSVVLGTLLAVLREAERAEVPLVLYLPDHSGREIHRVFSISGLDRILPLQRSWREAAVAATGGAVAPVDEIGLSRAASALPNVLWIGGSPRAGKTTVARRIARRHGLRWYNADAHTWEHRDRALAAGNAAAHRWEEMTSEERWVHATPLEQLELSLHAERGPMIVDDMRRLPSSPLTVAEGSTVSPEVVSAGIAAPSQAVWLIPTTELLRARLSEVGWPAELPVLLAATIERDAIEYGAPILNVDASRGVDEMVGAVEEAFAAALAQGPRAESTAERLGLLRYANDAVVSQCLAYLERPWTSGDAESMVRTFVCECEDPECDLPLELSVAAFQRSAEAGPVLARH